MKRCFFCKGKVVKRKIQHLYTWGERIILFEKVDAEVCTQCGETYFGPKVLKMMDRKAKAVSKPRKTIEIPVLSL